MANTPILNLEEVNSAGVPAHYTRDLEDDRVENGNIDKIDDWAGSVSGAFCETFFVSGALASHVGEPYGGIRFNSGGPKTIVRVNAIQANSGSGGVTRVDVRKAPNGSFPAVSYSLFSNNVFKAILSASAGRYTAAQTTTFAAGSSSWDPGQTLTVWPDSVTDGPSSDLTVQVWWRPSASYGQ